MCYIDFQNLKRFPHWNQHGDTVTIELWYGHRSIVALYWFSKLNTVSSLKPTWGYCYSINFTCHSGLCRDRGSFCAVSYININLSFFSPKSVELLFFRNILHLPIVIYIYYEHGALFQLSVFNDWIQIIKFHMHLSSIEVCTDTHKYAYLYRIYIIVALNPSHIKDRSENFFHFWV